MADVDGAFHESLAKFHALGALDADLNKFISVFIRSQIQRFYDKLYKTRRWHLIHGHVYTYSDVLAFIEESQKLIDAVRNKVEQIHDDACKVSEEFAKHQENHEVISCGTGVWVRDI